MRENQHKKIFIDLYHPIYEEDLITCREIIHLHKMDIITNVSIDNVIDEIRTRIFKYYGGGMIIRAEEMTTICYINVLILFGRDYEFLVEYFNSINSKDNGMGNIKEATHTELLFSLDYISGSEDIEELIVLFKDFGFDAEIKFRELNVFSRGADDYHENVILSLIKSISDGLGTGIGYTIGTKLAQKIFKKYENQDPRFNTVNTNKIVEYISQQTGINKHDLHITRLEPISGVIDKVVITSRYKTIIVCYDKSTHEVSYEVINKTQTMI